MRLDVTVVKPFETCTGIARVRPEGRIYTSRHGRCVFTGAGDHGNGRLGRVSDGTGPRCRWPTPGRAANISRPADWKGYHMTAPPKDILQRHDAWVENEKDYQRKLRLLQSLWREEQGFPIGEHRGRPSGNRLAMPEAKRTLNNYLTKTIRGVVRREVEGPKRHDKLGYKKLYQRPRIYNNLLSSQPLCFNLFGELTKNLALASRVLSDMSKGRVSQVTAIEFEWSPGRDDSRYLCDGTAFDVYVTYQTATGQRGFLGIEVKYHEKLEKKNNYRPRYDEVAAEMGCFHEEHLAMLRKANPLEQLWRNHLLMGAHRRADDFDEAAFVFLYPEVNTVCSEAAVAYRHCLSDTRTFEAWTLETFVSCLRQRTKAKWVRLFYDRYLDLSRLPL